MKPLVIWKEPLSMRPFSNAGEGISFDGVLKEWEGYDQISLESLPLTVPALEKGRLWTISGSENLDVKRDLEQPSSKESLRILVELLKGWMDLGQEVWLVVTQDSQARRLRDILAFYQIEAGYQPERRSRFGSGGPSIQIITGSLKAGFRLNEPALIFLTEEEIFGSRKESKKVTREELGSFASSLDDLKLGDFVVHRDHGIGRYQGLRFLRSDTWEGEFLFLEYGDSDKLYLPVDRIQGIHKFQGLEEQIPVLDRLGGNTWSKAKIKARKAVEKIARELVELYARRALVKGFSFSPRDQLFKEFEAGFPYDETPDQLRAIEEVLTDMESENPMDRLICGDVGYGKTEVAMRAAFRAVLDGKQVAFLVPTTVLAEQHFQTMQRRFQGYPVEYRALSRFKTPREQKSILEDLSEGRVDIVVGTHRLLQKDVRFRDLGLMIIDEEHRFGVSHKERLKTLKTQVDCLTLTATPIPRTLQFSLAGIRDLSTIETPPENRQSIRTFIARFEEDKIVEAVRQEMQRGGQVFFVHNRVHNIEAMAHFLKKILPGVRIGIAHGQLPERQLEKVMLRFIHRELDLLLCTTIIESGLDIPTANTIIINQADHFGLAQMYQLRGRVGRARERAYAYLMISAESTLTREAQKRLKVLMDFSELGAGFKIALHDLQIRGAGTLLGTRQSGHIAAVGYEMYMELLEESIREMKGETAVEDWEPELRLRTPAYIPENYIEDPGQRLSFYKRLSSVGDEEALDRMRAEMEDRFGQLPPEAGSLLQVLGAKIKMKSLGIEKMEVMDNELFLTLHPQGPWSSEKLLAAVQKKKGWLRFKGEGKLTLLLPAESVPLETLNTVLNQLSSLVH
jgi:transcription-repair coupling factor (superfamily II helicase)